MKQLLNTVLGAKTGVLSTIAEKTGKISFKRSIGIVLITKAFVNPGFFNEIGTGGCIVIGIALLAPAIAEGIKGLKK